MKITYRGRFAPSPTGPLHMGSLVAAMASFLDAKAHQGTWLLRIEDIDLDRNVAGADFDIMATLQRCQMQWDEEVVWQSQRTILYEEALKQLSPWLFPCSCSRKEIADSRIRLGLSDQAIYPGTCRDAIMADYSSSHLDARSIRLRVPEYAFADIQFEDRAMGWQQQNIASAVGDFILKRADGFWAYQLAVVVDDAQQGITHVVRGEDLIDSTARQIYLHNLLHLPTPRYLHIPVVRNQQGEKLSKQTGAIAFDRGDNHLLSEALIPACALLNLHLDRKAKSIEDFWTLATAAWLNQLNHTR